MKNFTLATIVLTTLISVGCKSEIRGGGYTDDPNVQYFPPGPEYKLKAEAKELRDAQTLEDE